MFYIIILAMVTALEVVYTIFDEKVKTSWIYSVFRIFSVAGLLVVSVKLQGFLFFVGIIIVPFVSVIISRIFFAKNKSIKNDVLFFSVMVIFILVVRF